MAKITGMNPLKGTSKKTGRAFDAVVVSMLVPYRDGDNSAVGNKAEEVFIDRQLFDKAAAGRDLKSLVGKDCRVFYNKSGFVESFEIAQ